MYIQKEKYTKNTILQYKNFISLGTYLYGLLYFRIIRKFSIYILVITDHLTRLAHVIPTQNMTARTKAQAFFDNFITYYGIPYRIHCDKGGRFEAKIIQELCEITGMKKI